MIGSCSETKTIVFWADLATNALSTLLLAASNNCVQLLSAPTRQDIDLAHIRGKWLDIGAPSVRNLPVLGSMRLSLYALLLISSIPLHLM